MSIVGPSNHEIYDCAPVFESPSSPAEAACVPRAGGPPVASRVAPGPLNGGGAISIDVHDPGGRPSVTEFQQWLGGDTFVMSVRCGTTPVVQGEDVTDDGEFCEG